MINKAEKIYQFIEKHVNQGRTVYACTPLRAIKIRKKNLDREQIKVNGKHCEVQMGREWVSINGTRIKAVE